MSIVDDASDRYTAAFLEQQAAEHAHISVVRLPQNQGFVRACNLGIAQGTAPYVVLVNSDVIVTPGWLSRLVRCAESDPRIAAVNPLTNRATYLDIPLAPGANFYDMDHVLAQQSPHHYPDVVTGVGFCLLLRRAALDQVGVFDEIYGRGYCEDSDLCMRLVAHGYRTVVADDVYVYHKGSASFLDQETRYQYNHKIFDARWAAEYRRQFRVFRQRNPLQPVRDLFQLPRHSMLFLMRSSPGFESRCERAASKSSDASVAQCRPKSPAGALQPVVRHRFLSSFSLSLRQRLIVYGNLYYVSSYGNLS